jgi:hypothetical protein
VRPLRPFLPTCGRARLPAWRDSTLCFRPHSLCKATRYIILRAVRCMICVACVTLPSELGYTAVPSDGSVLCSSAVSCGHSVYEFLRVGWMHTCVRLSVHVSPAFVGICLHVDFTHNFCEHVRTATVHESLADLSVDDGARDSLHCAHGYTMHSCSMVVLYRGTIILRVLVMSTLTWLGHGYALLAGTILLSRCAARRLRSSSAVLWRSRR